MHYIYPFVYMVCHIACSLLNNELRCRAIFRRAESLAIESCWGFNVNKYYMWTCNISLNCNGTVTNWKVFGIFRVLFRTEITLFFLWAYLALLHASDLLSSGDVKPYYTIPSYHLDYHLDYGIICLSIVVTFLMCRHQLLWALCWLR